MAKHQRIFIAFAIEDEWARDHLVGQMRNNRSPFNWTDMSVKNPWSTDWRNQCRTRIKGCDGMIAIITRNTPNANGQLFEIKTAREEGVPVMPMHARQTDRLYNMPSELHGLHVSDWTWDNISWFLGRL
jgi:hypothetical protein